MLKKMKQLAIAGSVSLASIPAFAATDYTALTGAVDFSAVATAILAVAALLAGLYVTIKGVHVVLSFMRGGK